MTDTPEMPHEPRAPRHPRVVLDPAAQRLVDALAAPPQLHQLGPHDGRSALVEAQDDTLEGPGVEVAFHVAPVGPVALVGYWDVRPVTEPADDGQAARPVVVFVHGGRWMFGDASTHGRLIRRLVRASGAVFLVPEYTRAPEGRYPVAVEETYELLVWTHEHAAEMGLDPNRIAVAGDCAGATVATATALLATRRGGPRLRAQLLYYPILDPACDSGSQHRFAADPVLGRDATRWYWRQYCDDPAQLREPGAAPAHAVADDLRGLPPTMIVTAEADVVRDEAEEYAVSLRRAGVPVTAVRYLGVTHDFVSLLPLRAMPAGRAAVAQGAAFLAEQLDG